MDIPVLHDEEHFLIRGPHSDLRLFLRRLGSSTGSDGPSVLYVHGATFPSALSVAYRFDGKSWRDALCASGFVVWGLDFYGFGNSDNYPEMAISADDGQPLGLAWQAAEQLLAAIRFILRHEQNKSLSLISHSWGSMPAGLVAAEHADLIEKWVAFAPIAQRTPTQREDEPSGPAWRLITAADQWTRFVEDVPKEESSVLRPRHFEAWAESYLATDSESTLRNPPSVKVPSGPYVEIKRAWAGKLAYDPKLVFAPVAIIRGAWDRSVPDQDARWLFDSFSHSKSKRDIKIARGTHLMHLEETRFELWSESINFLLASSEEANNIPLKAVNSDESRTPMLETAPWQNN